MEAHLKRQRDHENGVAIVKPNWPAPTHIIAGTTLRSGGVSHAPYHSLNLATHVDDLLDNVMRNRARLEYAVRQLNPLQADTTEQSPLSWQWLNQTHSSCVIALPESNHLALKKPNDAAISRQANTVCAVLTADCLPILVTDREGSQVAAIHAGWRGLCGGVVANTINALQKNSPTAQPELIAWLGPCIRQSHYEVGGDMRKTVLAAELYANNPMRAALAFEAVEEEKNSPNKYRADLASLAKIALNSAGVFEIYDSELCTVEQDNQFFSYRRDGRTGRIASFIFIAASDHANTASK